ncbi:hypothetical protein BDY17DRAFT_295238 [Neohortaea acidophila]|uniref:Amidohydrolase-related domain-containing protein n=1 Tax=Neohortaea acidophila TaxID=245834 RepID=A0A6A6PW68_9PEZI|nr:uncharacterized protein BDY17DRAFT_295238 [Neohortaea acidophila]KAF2484225.1 hypothetical protein BDY17DRAFT_295238 [Neohortaea acidophila]
MDKDILPKYTLFDERVARRPKAPSLRRILKLSLLAGLVWALWTSHSSKSTPRTILSSDRLRADYATCAKLRHKPQDPSGPRERNARYLDGHKPYLIRNASVWTGEPNAHHGVSDGERREQPAYSWIHADVLLHHGLIKRVEADIAAADLPDDYVVYQAHGRPLTSGIVDMHSHVGVSSMFEGSSDDNELSNDITPFVRSIDGFNPLEEHIQIVKSGGVTTSLILPGSGNNMGGEAYVVKHAVGKADGRSEISAEDMLADPEKLLRYMKMACGENAKRVYGKVGRDFGPFSRLGEAWYFRHAFEQASALVAAQDDWCNAADRLGAHKMSGYLPQDLKWESLGALLRGQVLLNTHCYTIPDLESFVGYTNEFNFSVRAFHHAHMTYLVPEILKRAYGDRPPASALFADQMYYKAESYVASEQAGKILWENGLTPVYVSDNPVLNAQHVVFEAAKAYKNGLPYHVALAGVTSASADILGLGERIGKVKAGFDADIVVWDSDPLSVGAAPVQIWIDGTPQYEHPVELKKALHGPIEHQSYLASIKEEVSERSEVIFSGITKILSSTHDATLSEHTHGNVIVKDGAISCLGECENELAAAQERGALVVTLENGHIAPSLTTFGSSLGLVEIAGESVTQDGSNGDENFSRAVDGLAFDAKELHAAFSHGVTKAITAPLYKFGGFYGVSAGFATGALHAQEKGAVWKDEVALHYALAKSTASPSLSSAIGALKAKLIQAINANETDSSTRPEQRYLKKVVQDKMALVIQTDSADQIASLLRLKAEVEAEIAASTTVDIVPHLRMIIQGGAESHLLAAELAKANVAVILSPLLASRGSWDQRRALTGAPLTNGTAIDVLHAAGVKVAIGTDEQLPTRDLYLSAGIAHANSNGKISETEALAFVSSNIYDILGLKKIHSDAILQEFTVFEGNPLEIDGQIRAIADGRGKVSVRL